MAFPVTGNILATSQMNILGDQDQTPAFLQAYRKGQPKALGTVQISLAFVQFLVGTILLYTMNAFTSITVYSWITYWGGFLYILSGSLAVSADNKQSRGLVKGSLSTNLISAVASLGEVSLTLFDIVRAYYYNYGPCTSIPCSLFQDTIFVIRLITLILLLIISVLQFCVSISVFTFSIRSLKAKTLDAPQPQNVYHNPIFPTFNMMQHQNPYVSNPPAYNTQNPY